MITPAHELKPKRMIAIAPCLEVVKSFIDEANERGECCVDINLATLDDHFTVGQIMTIIKVLHGAGYIATYTRQPASLTISWD